MATAAPTARAAARGPDRARFLDCMGENSTPPAAGQSTTPSVGCGRRPVAAVGPGGPRWDGRPYAGDKHRARWPDFCVPGKREDRGRSFAYARGKHPTPRPNSCVPGKPGDRGRSFAYARGKHRAPRPDSYVRGKPRADGGRFAYARRKHPTPRPRSCVRVRPGETARGRTTSCNAGQAVHLSNTSVSLYLGPCRISARHGRPVRARV